MRECASKAELYPYGWVREYAYLLKDLVSYVEKQHEKVAKIAKDIHSNGRI